MDGKIYSTDECIIVDAISKNDSLRKAANHLNCDPSSLQRKVQYLAEEDIFVKVNNKWTLTDKGKKLIQWFYSVQKSQIEALTEKRHFNIFASDWIQQEILIPFVLRTNDYNFTLLSRADNLLENLYDSKLDLAFTCSIPPKNPELGHVKLIPEKWFLYTPKSLKDLSFKQVLETTTLILHQKQEYLLSTFFKEHKVELDIVFTDSLMSIKRLIESGKGCGVLPELLFLGDKTCYRHKEYNKNNSLYLWYIKHKVPQNHIATIKQEFDRLYRKAEEI